MRRTALGALVGGTAWLAILVAFLVGSVALALAGAFTIAAVETTRSQLKRSTVQIRRDAPEAMRIGEQTTITTTATAQTPVPLWVDDIAPAPLKRIEATSMAARGLARMEQRVQATDAGTAKWRDVEVRVADRWAMHERRGRVPAYSLVHVAPEADWVQQGRRAGRRHTVQTMVKGRRQFESLPQIESIREYQPGDRMRDIDWARSSRMPRLHTKVRERVTPRPLLVLLDATAPMRYQKHRAKITSAARLAYGLSAAAQAAGVEARIVAFDEQGIMEAGPRPVDVVKRLAKLDAPLPVSQIPAAAAGGIMGRSERGFLGALSALTAGATPPAPPLDAAIGRLTHGASDRALVVAVLDGESDPQGTVRALTMLRRGGHDTILVIPSGPAHHHDRHDADVRAIDAVLARRRRLLADLEALKVPAMVLRPSNVDRIIREVAASAE